MATGRRPDTRKNKASFLKAFARVGVVTHAAAAAKVSRSQVYEWLEHDEAFAADFDHAKEAGHDELEREAWRRAVEGVDEPVFYQGEEVALVRKYSDTLLIFLLKGAKPHKYAERRIDLSEHERDELAREFGKSPEQVEADARALRLVK